MRILSTDGKVLFEAEDDVTDLSNRDLHEAKLTDRSYAGFNFSHATLVSAFLMDGDFAGANFSSASLEGAGLADGNFERANFERADLYWVIAFGANFRSANLRLADLRGADLNEVDFSGADLQGANLGLDNLNGSTSVLGANFETAILAAAVFAGAKYSSATRFPPGFDPVAAGMLLSAETAT